MGPEFISKDFLSPPPPNVLLSLLPFPYHYLLRRIKPFCYHEVLILMAPLTMLHCVNLPG